MERSLLWISDRQINCLSFWLKIILRYLVILPSMTLCNSAPSRQVTTALEPNLNAKMLSAHSPLCCTKSTDEEKSRMSYQHICLLCSLHFLVCYYMIAAVMKHVLSLCISMRRCLWLNSHLIILISPQNWNS